MILWHSFTYEIPFWHFIIINFNHRSEFQQFYQVTLCITKTFWFCNVLISQMWHYTTKEQHTDLTNFGSMRHQSIEPNDTNANSIQNSYIYCPLVIVHFSSILYQQSYQNKTLVEVNFTAHLWWKATYCHCSLETPH